MIRVLSRGNIESEYLTCTDLLTGLRRKILFPSQPKSLTMTR
jgi:hypothetical protein